MIRARVSYAVAAALLIPGWLAAAPSPPSSSSSSSSSSSPYITNDAAVSRAMGDELARSMKDLKLGDSPAPYYLAYALSDVSQATVSATFGAVTGLGAYRGRTIRTDVRVGDHDFDNGNTTDSLFGASVEALPVDDDYEALRRELWLRTDEGYKSAVETLAKKRSAASGQMDGGDDVAVADFSRDTPAKVVVPFPGHEPEAGELRDVVARLSAVFRDLPDVSGCRVTGTYATVRRRFVSSEGASSDEKKGTARVDAVAETQAPDGMRLVSYATFTALTPSGLPPLADMQRAVRRMAAELVAMRRAPVAASGAAVILFEGAAAGQVAKVLLGDNLSGTPAPRTAAGGEERGQTSELADRRGQKVASSLLMAVDDPTRDTGPGKSPLFGSYRVDDEGIAAQRVTLIEGGQLKGLLMTRTPRKEMARSNGHARATRFGVPRALVGNLIISGKAGAPRAALDRAALLAHMAKVAKSESLTAYIVKVLDDPSIPGVANPDDGGGMVSIAGGGRSAPPVKPLVVYRLSADGKEELVRGLTIENLVPRSLRDIEALGKDIAVYNFQEGGLGFSGIPSSIVTPSLLFSDVDVRRSVGKNRRPPLYPRPEL